MILILELVLYKSIRLVVHYIISIIGSVNSVSTTNSSIKCILRVPEEDRYNIVGII